MLMPSDVTFKYLSGTGAVIRQSNAIVRITQSYSQTMIAAQKLCDNIASSMTFSGKTNNTLIIRDLKSKKTYTIADETVYQNISRRIHTAHRAAEKVNELYDLVCKYGSKEWAVLLELRGCIDCLSSRFTPWIRTMVTDAGFNSSQMTMV